MDKQQAQQIIKETFEQPFEKGRFTEFTRNFLNHIDESKAFHARGDVKEMFRKVIKTYERLGTYTDPEGKKIDIIAAYLQKEVSIDRARVAQRNFAGRYLADRGRKDAALVAYVSPDQTDWRFSLVKMDYKFEKTKTGRMKAKEEFTPARRWSFLVGENEKSHTAQSRLVNILADDERSPTLEELENGFDIETVTKEFFLKYRDLFLRTKEALDKLVKKDQKIKADFEAKGVDTVNFAKKLLGQIIFLYFLQKKGWFGVGRDDDWGTGSKHFLRSLFDKKHSDYNNFFNDILEPLFYEALRIDRTHDDDYYSRFNCKIPFLNGGLFDPIGNYDWVHTDINLPDTLFSNTRKTREGDIGDGILDVFDRYNFTVREDEPLEKEVAIDPELLGKAYEKFNAIRSDNFNEFQKALNSGRRGEENKFNKKFGVYYTPREIVHYMCKQSLINYLHTRADEAKLSSSIKKTDIEDLIEVGELISEHEAMALIKQEKIKNGIQKSSEYTQLLADSICENAKALDEWLADITVCDPAVGSGAFPVGMMNEIVRARNVLSVFLNGLSAYDAQADEQRNEYAFKRRCIEHSLYGVDIDSGAVEIAKLRLWLSLMVDEDDIKNIKPLPNLDYRIMQGNSLISEFMGINFDDDREKDTSPLLKDKTDELIELFQQKKDEFLNESNVSQKKKLKEEIDNLLVEIFETRLKTQKTDFFNRLKNIENKYSVLPNEKQRNETIEQEKQKLYKDSNFDLETAEKQLKEFTSGRQVKPFFLWDLYFSEVFHGRGGFDVVIANPPYFNLNTVDKKNVAGLKRSYEKIHTGYNDIAYYFIYLSLKQLSSTGMAVLITSNYYLGNEYARKLRIELAPHVSKVLNFKEHQVFSEASVHTCITFLQAHPANDTVHFYESGRGYENSDAMLEAVLNHIPIQRKQLGEQWLIVSDNAKALIEKIHEKSVLLGDIAKIAKGSESGKNSVFTVSDELIQEKKIEKSIIRNCVKNSNINKYYLENTGKRLIYTDNNFDKNLFPQTFTYLKYHKNTLVKRRGPLHNEYKWWRLHRPSLKDIFDATEKILVPYRSPHNTFAYDNEQHFNDGGDIRAIVVTDERFTCKYVLALLNSTLLDWFYGFIGKPKGNAREYFNKPLSLIPIKLPPTVKDQEDIEELVNKILALKKKNPNTNISTIEAEIDQLVYQLYGLTDKEIKIVEGRTK